MKYVCLCIVLILLFLYQRNKSILEGFTTPTRYIDRDFNTLRNSLIQYSKTYFPNTYNDFTETSTGMLFMEMAAYVGDVLSFYLDNQIQETFIQKARQTTNLYALAYSLGYVPKITTAASVEIDFFQQVPAILSGSVYVPDFDY